MKSKKFWICSLLIIMGTVAVILGVANQGIEVETLTIAHGPIEQWVEDTGTVKSRQSRTIYIETSGKITEILVEKGDVITKGTLLLKLDPTNRRIAEIAAQQAKTNYDLVQQDWDKIQKLYLAGAVSRKEYETAKADLNNAAKDYQAAKLKLEQSIASTLLRAPRAGIILDRLVEPQLYAPEGTAAFVIGGLSDLEIEAEILAEDAVNIRPGNPVIISGKATGEQQLQGRVIKIAPIAKNVVSSLGINQKRRTVTIALNQTTGKLRPGVDVDVKIITKRKSKVIKVPLSAIFEYEGRTCVFVVKNGEARIQPVHKNIENNAEVEIESGLKVKDRIIIRPDNRISNGTKVKLRKRV
ncbi:MAG TPA: efflux RND transporter periplasmic adaptor subunit [Bacillota bacterium]